MDIFPCESFEFWWLKMGFEAINIAMSRVCKLKVKLLFSCKITVK